MVDTCAGPVASKRPNQNQLMKEPWTDFKLGEAKSQGVLRVELKKFTRLMQNQAWLCGKRTQHRDNGGCPSSSHFEGTQFSFSLYVSAHPPTPQLTGLTTVFQERLQHRPRLVAAKKTWGMNKLSGISRYHQSGASGVQTDAGSDLVCGRRA